MKLPQGTLGPATRVAAAAAVVLALLGAAGCASVPAAAPQPVPEVLADALFDPGPAEVFEARDLFALTPAMRRHLDERLALQRLRQGPQRALVEALYAKGELRLEYDASFTRTASEAFDARQGNCLSLVIMTAAFARELGLQVRFQEVLGAPAWEQSGELTFVVGHVNLALGEGPGQLAQALAVQQWLVVDFLPGQDLKAQRTRVLDETRVRALYMNNRAAEELSRGRVDAAYGWARAALRADPGLVHAYNTLGVIYRHRGAWAEARRAMQAALRLDPTHEHAASNLAALDGLRPRGDAPPARLAAAAAAVVEPDAPAAARSARFDQARQALDEGRLKQAWLLLHGELGLTPRSAELHYWLAVTSARMGNGERAQRELELAAEYSVGEQRALYGSKLARLRAHRGGSVTSN